MISISTRYSRSRMVWYQFTKCLFVRKINFLHKKNLYKRTGINKRKIYLKKEIWKKINYKKCGQKMKEKKS